MIEQRVALRYGEQQIPPCIQAVQGDTGRDIIFELVDYEIPEGATVNYYVEKPSGEAVYNSAEMISSSEIMAHLTQQAIVEAGRSNGQVRILLGDEVITSFKFVIEVEQFIGANAIPSGTETNIFDEALQAAAEDAIAEIQAQTPVVTGMQNSIAPSYSASSTYSVGDYVMYNAQLYRCVTAITTAEAWTAAHWTQVPLATDVSNLKSALDALSEDVNGDISTNYTVGKNLTANSVSHAIIDDPNSCLSDYIAKTWETNKIIFIYTDDTTGTTAYQLWFFDSSKDYLGYRGWSGAGSTARDATPPEGTAFVRFSFKKGFEGKLTDNSPTPTVIYTATETVVSEGLSQKVGNLLDLDTTDKSSIVSAINEAIDDCNDYSDATVENAVDKLTEEWEYVEPKNWLIEDELTTGKYLKVDGSEGINANYCYTGKINVNPGDIVRVKTRDSVGQYHVTDTARMNFLCAFDADGNPVPEKGFGTSTEAYTVPDGIYGVVISKYTNSMANGLGMVLINNSDELEYTPYFEPYWRSKDPFMPQSFAAVSSVSVGTSPTRAYLATMNNGDSFECGKTTARKNKIIDFRALITTMGQFTIWNANSNVYFDSKVVIDATNVTVYSATTTDGYVQSFTDAHGLTFADYIHVEIALDANGASKIKIETNGASYEHENIGFNGRENVKASSEGAVFTNAYLSFVAQDIKKPLWVFGDSYTQLSGNAYWTKHIVDDGYDNFLLCGFPGAKSEPLYPEWRNMLSYGKPQYVLWAMGMNDADNVNSVNSSWKLYLDLFLEDCGRYGITPILATIPNVPNVKHTYKNAIVRASGRRYVDFAQAVGAESEGSGWFTGMLKSDQVHPTEQGAICLAAQVLAQMPEIMQ